MPFFYSVDGLGTVVIKAMSIDLKLTPLPSPSNAHIRFSPAIPKPRFLHLSFAPETRNLLRIRCTHERSDHFPAKPKWENALSVAASLCPLYVTVGAFVACVKPSTFSWFVARAPVSYSLSLGFIMLAMGFTLELTDFFGLFRQRPLSVTLIAQGDVSLSIVMTACTTLGAVILTPLLTKILAGTYVPVNAVQLSISTLQVVVAPILLGSYVQGAFPAAVRIVTPFAPLFAVLTSALLACSVFSENVVCLKSSAFGASLTSDLSPVLQSQSIFSGVLGGVIFSVLLLHFAGFFVGYVAAAIAGFAEPQRRAVSIEVGMQNSSLGAVLATAHFSSRMVALPAAMSAVIMNVMGSSLAFVWRHSGHPHPDSSSSSQ